ncbi:hypothetical protein, partial [Reyranella soli]|uniref:hypothetical protein n=1 Tax=Reyranella soli TaxID=1230389 RepID=UPI001C3F56EA
MWPTLRTKATILKAAQQLRPTADAVMAERLARTGIDPKLVGERLVDVIRNRTLLRLRQRRAGRHDQGAAPPHRCDTRDPLGDAVLV